MHFEKYQDKHGEWRWRIVAANNRIVADSGEGYANEANVDRALDTIINFGRMISDATIIKPVKVRRGGGAVSDKIASIGQVLLMSAKKGQNWNADRS